MHASCAEEDLRPLLPLSKWSTRTRLAGCHKPAFRHPTPQPPKEGTTKTAKPFGMQDDSRNSRSSNQPCRRYCSTFVGPRDTRKPSMASKTAFLRKHAWLAWWGQDCRNERISPQNLINLAPGSLTCLFYSLLKTCAHSASDIKRLSHPQGLWTV